MNSDRDDLAMLNSLTRNVPGVLYQFQVAPDGSLSFPYISPGFERLFGIAPEILQSDATKALSVVRESDRATLLESISRSISEKSGWDCEFRLASRKRSTIWVGGHATPETADDGTVLFHGYTWDITARKRSEERIREMLDEKQLLIREVHHRVKNNVATILSLLELQRSTAGNKEVSDALHAAQNRVRSVLLLYEQLSREESTETVRADRYFSRLVTQVVDGLTDSEGIGLQVDIGEIELDGKMLSVLALIINESITNAVKHAFADQPEPKISVELSRRDAGGLRLTIRDNGAGLGEDNNEGFGMMLIRSLAEQLRSSLSIRDEAGTCIELDIPDSA